jgi:hypothetical protein
VASWWSSLVLCCRRGLPPGLVLKQPRSRFTARHNAAAFVLREGPHGFTLYGAFVAVESTALAMAGQLPAS